MANIEITWKKDCGVEEVYFAETGELLRGNVEGVDNWFWQSSFRITKEQVATIKSIVGSDCWDTPDFERLPINITPN